ncbi:hypothetical protein [Hymenobacter sp. B1770]|uniref:hypothetical protein n=1 Tax=Hymenobacter sp. B1770 TaxID=1718788 RepID=UPI003CEF4A61
MLLTVGGAALIAVAHHVSENSEIALGKPARGPLPAFTGFFSLVIAFVLAVDCPDFAIDKVKRRYRHFTRLLGVRVGEWKKCPQVTSVVIKYFSEYTVAGRRNWQVNTPEQSYIVMLSSEAVNHKGIIVHKFSYRDKEQAVQVATELADYLAVPCHYFDEP